MDFSLVNLLVVLLVGWTAGALVARIGYPSILGELAAGILLGPAVLGWLQPDGGLDVLAEVGVFLLMLYIGIEVDHRELFGASWAGLLAAMGGFIFPAVFGYLVASRFEGIEKSEALFLGIALGVTALVVNSRILVDLKLLGTRVGNVLIAGALISDTVAIVVFAGMIRLLNPDVAPHGGLMMIAAKAVLFFGVTTLLGLFVFPFVGRRLVQAGLTQRTANFTLVLLVALVFAEMAELAGLHAILGAFLAGLFLREEVLMRKLSQDISALVHDLSIGFLAPIFFVTVGFDVSLDVFRTELGLLVAIIAVATISKIGGTLLFYLPTGYGWREGLIVGAGMNGRGAVEIIFAGIGLKMGIIDQDVFSILVFMAFFTTATVPMLLKWGTEWLRRRGELVVSDSKRVGVLIVGAGSLARALARELAATEPVRLVDTNTENCALAQAEGLTVIHGNALREETLSMVNAGRARAMITMTTNPEVNRFAAQLARDAFGVPEVHMPEVQRQANGSSGGTTGTASGIALFGGEVAIDEWNQWVTRKEVERVTFVVARATRPDALFRELNEGDRMLPLLAVREGHAALFHTMTELREGDEIIALQHRDRGDGLAKRLDRVLQYCPVLDLSESIPMEAFFERVAQVMADRVRIPAGDLLELLLQRELDSSTVILPGVAIPHVLVDGQNTFDMLLARCREGIRFSDLATQVRMVFVIIGTRDERNVHLRALSAIGQLFQKKHFEEKWIAAEDPEALRQLVLSIDRRL